MGAVQYYTEYLEKKLDYIFALYSSVPNYTIVDNIKQYGGFVPASEFFPPGYVTPFSSEAANHKFNALIDVMTRLQKHSRYSAFLKISYILKREEYNEEIADTIDVVHYLINGVDQYIAAHSYAPPDMKQFLHECMQNGLEFALE